MKEDLLYIPIFLHQTTTFIYLVFNSTLLYIPIFLHQTTTQRSCFADKGGCISLYSYIKPQL